MNVPRYIFHRLAGKLAKETRPIRFGRKTVLALCLMGFGATVQAQQLNTLHAFQGNDGYLPLAGLTKGDDGNFYGVTELGGANSSGTAFQITPGGSYTLLYSFGANSNDGKQPSASLIKGNDGNFYGTTSYGGTGGNGTIFKMTPSGAITILHSFSFNEGTSPMAELLLGADGNFYGTAAFGGSNSGPVGSGTVFKMAPNGTVTVLYSFSAAFGGQNADGQYPAAGLTLGADGKLYGTTRGGGTQGNGTLFVITTTGNFTSLYSFGSNSGDGATPLSRLVRGADNAFYGACSAGGAGLSTIFRMTTSGTPQSTAVQTLYTFSGGKTDGGSPNGLIQAGDGNFYGTAGVGGNFNQGTIFKITPGGSFTLLYSFGANSADGSSSVSPLVQGSDSGFYGTTSQGGVGGDGTVFKFGGTPVITPPAHGGLSTTYFQVNGDANPAYPPTSNPVTEPADAILQFAAFQATSAAGLSVRLQATTAPANEGSWSDLTNTTHGGMIPVPPTNVFLLSTRDYPKGNGVYFRTIASAQGYQDSISNIVGPFNLSASANPEVGPVRLDFTGNGSLSDLYFRATATNPPSGITVRIQSSTVPLAEQTWQDLTDISNNNVSAMTRSTNKDNPNSFQLLLNQFPTTQGVYFRAIASAPGYVDSISNFMGPFDITADTPPTTTILPPQGLSGSGDGHDVDHAILINAGPSNFGAVARGPRLVTRVRLRYDGAVIREYPGDANQNTLYTVNFIASPGDHILEAEATDDLGGRARAESSATYIRVLPNSSASRTATSDGSNARAASLAGGRTFVVANSGGEWHDPSTWKALDGINDGSVPGADDFAIIGSSAVHYGFEVAVGSVSISPGGKITADLGGNLSVFGTLTILGGTFNCVLINLGTCELLNPTDIQFGGQVVNHGTWRMHGSGGVRGLDQFDNDGVYEWSPAIQIPPNAATDPAAALRILQATNVTNGGSILGNYSALLTPDGASLIGHDGGSLIGHDGGSLVAAGGGNLIGHDGGSLIGHDGGSLIGHDGGSLIAAGGGNLIAAGGGNFKVSANSTLETNTSGITQTGGEINLNAVTIVGPLTLNGGVLSGTGFVDGDLTNNGGDILPGGMSGPGAIAVIGNFTQGAGGMTVIERTGPNASQFDQIQVGGTANLGGKLDVKNINGYVPSAADTFNPLGYQAASGSFSAISSNAQLSFSSTGAVAITDPAKPNPSPGQPINISTRMNVLAGDNALIAGFIVTGPNGSTKRVLIRGIGPSLANFGVSGTLSDPFLELHKPDGAVVSNDNWQQGDTSQIPNGFAPGDPRESVIVATLAPGNYSAVLKGAHGETGVGIAEAYDLDPSSAAQLANISTRGFVNTGDNVMIGGFIVGGSEPAKVLVRAIGPSLAAFGVQGALPATTLELHDANGAVISNEGWRNTQEADIIATTIPPSNDNEAAILATLVPGNYTAVVRGKNNTTGIGLVEAYNLP